MARFPAPVLCSDGSAPHKIVVFRALQLGDVLCSIPAFRALRTCFSESEITFISLPWARAFTERFSSFIDRFIEFPGYPGFPEREADITHFPSFLHHVQKHQFDLAIQLHGDGSHANPITALFGARLMAGFYKLGNYCPNPRTFMAYPEEGSEIVRLVRLMAFLGIDPCGLELEFPLRREDQQALHAIPPLSDLQARSYVCIHPGARWLSRRWTPQGFAAVGDALAAQGFRVVLTGSHEEAPLIEQVGRLMSAPFTNAVGLTSLGSLAALLHQAALLICNDTGVSHLAAALKVPSVVLCMGSDPERWAPLDKDFHSLVSVPIDCRPCNHFSCPIGHPCATRLEPKKVIQAAHRTLQRPRGKLSIV